MFLFQKPVLRLDALRRGVLLDVLPRDALPRDALPRVAFLGAPPLGALLGAPLGAGPTATYHTMLGCALSVHMWTSASSRIHLRCSLLDRDSGDLTGAHSWKQAHIMKGPLD